MLDEKKIKVSISEKAREDLGNALENFITKDEDEFYRYMQQDFEEEKFDDLLTSLTQLIETYKNLDEGEEPVISEAEIEKAISDLKIILESKKEKSTNINIKKAEAERLLNNTTWQYNDIEKTNAKKALLIIKLQDVGEKFEVKILSDLYVKAEYDVEKIDFVKLKVDVQILTNYAIDDLQDAINNSSPEDVIQNLKEYKETLEGLNSQLGELLYSKVVDELIKQIKKDDHAVENSLKYQKRFTLIMMEFGEAFNGVDPAQLKIAIEVLGPSLKIKNIKDLIKEPNKTVFLEFIKDPENIKNLALLKEDSFKDIRKELGEIDFFKSNGEFTRNLGYLSLRIGIPKEEGIERKGFYDLDETLRNAIWGRIDEYFNQNLSDDELGKELADNVFVTITKDGYYRLYTLNETGGLPMLRAAFEVRGDVIHGHVKTWPIPDVDYKKRIREDLVIKGSVPKILIEYYKEYDKTNSVKYRPQVLENLQNLIKHTCIKRNIFGRDVIDEKKLKGILDVFKEADSSKPMVRNDDEHDKDYAVRMACNDPLKFAARAEIGKGSKGDEYLKKMGGLTDKEVVQALLRDESASGVKVKKSGNPEAASSITANVNVEITRFKTYKKWFFFNETYVVDATVDDKHITLAVSKKDFKEMFLDVDGKSRSLDSEKLNSKPVKMEAADRVGLKVREMEYQKNKIDPLKALTRASSASKLPVVEEVGLSKSDANLGNSPQATDQQKHVGVKRERD